MMCRVRHTLGPSPLWGGAGHGPGGGVVSQDCPCVRRRPPRMKTPSPLPRGERGGFSKEAPMFIGYFTERPYQDPQSGYFGATGRPITDLHMSNGEYNAELGADLYNR